ncbi:hypothetical protein HK100_012889 [Physocladia obscura]|uniref:OTU domain-containing protein n=1 Tax=Physocladia obscura TaxID=109957 RepID=A0AAD5SZ27_9FUNG|nr:hypothetical protein HK100_012889 [Physocladia obscura]
MKRKPNNEKTAPVKKQPKKDKRTPLPPDVRKLWAKATTSTQAPQPVTRPDDYEPGDSDFEESSLSRIRSVKSSNPRESNGNNGVNIAPHQNPLIRISHAADLQLLPNNLKPSGFVVGDGSCLPRSILLVLTGSQNGYQQLRQSVVQRILSSELQFEPDIYRLYNCSVDDYCTRMADVFEFGDIIFVMAAALVLEVEIQVFTFSSDQNGASSLTSQIFTPSHRRISTIQIHLDSGHSEHWNVDAETGLRWVTNVLVREPHFDTLVGDDRRDSGEDDMKRKLSSPDNECSDLLLEVKGRQPLLPPPRQLLPPSPPPPIVPAVPSAPLRSTTIRPGQNPKNRAYVVGVSYEVSYLAESVDAACLEPPPACPHFFEIPSWDVMWNGMRQKTRDDHEAAVLEMINETGKARSEIEEFGRDCCGNTFELPGGFWVSTCCFYRKKLNVMTTGQDAGHVSGLRRNCRGCLANHNTLNNMLRRTFNIETALRCKAHHLIGNKEWTTDVKPDISYSLILRVLRNQGFIHLRTQADVIAIRQPLSKAEQADHLAWIKARTHYGFRTGAELILLTEAGLNMISFDRSNSDKKIDELGQTVVTDSWGFNRLSNSLSEKRTDRLLRELLAGDYAEGNAAFIRRNGGGEPRHLSKEWEDSIIRVWSGQTPEARLHAHQRRLGVVLPDIRFWGTNGGLPEFQKLCRLNANENGNMVDEITGAELCPDDLGIDRVINGIVAGLSGEYCNGQTLIVHRRVNDMKEADGRKVFATLETLELEKRRRNLVQPDHRIATQLIMREYLTQIRIFRNSQSYRDNMDRLVAKKNEN